ncbi:MAG: acetoacetate decarboxylase family protein [Synechococcales bacterium]|nr:acetoacetate decarboxylase family protein [Synechococcales bacterium]
MTFYAAPTVTTPYPPAPWQLQGQAIQTLQPIDVAIARPTVPAELDIVQVLPGKTLAGIYLAHYGAGSDLEYHELIVVSAVVRRSDRIGVWISHIYVDNPHSVAGGRMIWGLPKELAEFSWRRGDRGEVAVSQGEKRLCTLAYHWKIPAIWLPWLPMAGFSTSGSELLWYSVTANTQPYFLPGVEVKVPGESPLMGLGLHQPWLAFAVDPLHLSVREPQVVGSTASRAGRS